MKRIKKAVLMPIKSFAYKCNQLRVYYWADRELYELRSVSIMPRWYYRRLYHACMWLVEFRQLRSMANRAIHTIPYHVRFEVA